VAATIRGAILGAVIGVLMLAIGMVRAALAHVPISVRELTPMLVYVVAFAAAGAVVGALHRLLGTRGGRFLVGAVAGAILTGIFLTFDHGLPTTWGRTPWLTLAICTVILGCFGLKLLTPVPGRRRTQPPAS
jgi:hypothetical protein